VDASSTAWSANAQGAANDTAAMAAKTMRIHAGIEKPNISQISFGRRTSECPIAEKRETRSGRDFLRESAT
jgi:hypothetical protein